MDMFCVPFICSGKHQVRRTGLGNWGLLGVGLGNKDKKRIKGSIKNIEINTIPDV